MNEELQTLREQLDEVLEHLEDDKGVIEIVKSEIEDLELVVQTLIQRLRQIEDQMEEQHA